jgi:hypothetical protein
VANEIRRMRRREEMPSSALLALRETDESLSVEEPIFQRIRNA